MMNILNRILLILVIVLPGFNLTCLAEIHYTYDNIDRLVKVEYDDGKVIEYSYDEAGNRLVKNISVPISELYAITGSGYIFPETPSYKATFSMDITGPTEPSGCLKYYYGRTRLNFVSTAVTAISVQQNTATISGAGTVNGAAGYTFTATVTDASPDTFGITIRKPDGSNHHVVEAKASSGGDLSITQQ